jgi:protein-S-isoprenylcysteine O-methyltransferase Ste14
MARAALFTVVFFFVAPGTTAGLVPWWLTGWHRPDVDVGPLDALGVALIVAGLVVVVACFTRFVTEGAGTPAPTAPTESLVVGGLYRYVRNPMYLAVASIIGGEALLLRSPEVGLWLLGFMTLVWSFVRVYEEPALTRQFGAAYEHYRSAVPGWWPRRQPYRGLTASVRR